MFSAISSQTHNNLSLNIKAVVNSFLYEDIGHESLLIFTTFVKPT